MFTARFAITLIIAAFLMQQVAFAQSDSEKPIPPVEFARVMVEMGGQVYELEYAVTFEQRVRGLMYRRELCEDCGMLFSFSPPQRASIWMKNTYVPLDLAYVNVKGVIIAIHPLTPLNTESVYSRQRVAYAVEMNQGWFAANNIKVGDSIVVRQNNL